MNVERLVAMANDIGRYFASEQDRKAAVAGIASHLQRFWDPRMRRQILAHVAAGGQGLSDLALAAVKTLPAPAAPATLAATAAPAARTPPAPATPTPPAE